MSVRKVRASAGLHQRDVAFKTSYESKPVAIPDSFLTTETHTGPAVTYSKLDFSQSAIPEYQDHYAVILDNVLSPEECNQLITFAEQSTGAIPAARRVDPEPKPSSALPKDDNGVEMEEDEMVPNNGWQPALVNAGLNREFLATDYRNSERIIWDERTIVARLWERCLLAPGLRDDLSVLEGDARGKGKSLVPRGHRWLVTRLNERMRFLRYGPGQFFREHCDGTYGTADGKERTYYTLHLYLNDDIHGPQTLHEGGATTFHAPSDSRRRIDVNPKSGRVLIFQHAGLLHSGDTVLKGTKYTMRSDLLFTRDGSAGDS